MNKRKFVAPRLKAGVAPGRGASSTSPTALGPERKRLALPKPKLSLVGTGAGPKAPDLGAPSTVQPKSRDVCCPSEPQGPLADTHPLGHIAAPPAAPAPARAPPSRRIFRLPVIPNTSMPTLESLGFDVSLPQGQTVLRSLPKAAVPEEFLVHPATLGAEALAAAAAALHEAALPEYLDLPQRQTARACILLGISKLPYEPRCRARVEAMGEGPSPALAPQPRSRCPPSDATRHSVSTSIISGAVWVPTPDAEAKPGAAAAARHRLAEGAEIPLAALKAMLLG